MRPGVAVGGMRPWQARALTALMISVAGMTLAACASAARSSGSGSGAGSSDSCVAGSLSADLALARVVFTGTALPGPAVSAGTAGAVLASPARFRVSRYLKGSGPPVVTVQTALSIRGDTVVAGEDGIEPRAGQRWMIYTASLRMPYQTSDCGGSCVLGGSADDVNIPCGPEGLRK